VRLTSRLLKAYIGESKLGIGKPSFYENVFEYICTYDHDYKTQNPHGRFAQCNPPKQSGMPMHLTLTQNILEGEMYIVIIRLSY
jgi:hypothetical protein